MAVTLQAVDGVVWCVSFDGMVKLLPVFLQIFHRVPHPSVIFRGLVNVVESSVPEKVQDRLKLPELRHVERVTVLGLDITFAQPPVQDLRHLPEGGPLVCVPWHPFRASTVGTGHRLVRLLGFSSWVTVVITFDPRKSPSFLAQRGGDLKQALVKVYVLRAVGEDLEPVIRLP
eukprot:CAMPEP_0185771030 /NCGR_PEP_ID=MMETSP1174-20130828/62826_1 /TAXON_ID=35687 /ORGANISM="Dictyocha speculum, Strain CCMP1381" /LENGTH=172 /DNA_ID=CAMNT_0028456745 /DNA_START=527 /DNA_END=1045 /DNA_ORIENTATION=+